MPVPPALTPALALDYVRELSADVRAVLLLGREGEPLAGPAQLGEPARALLATSPTVAELEVVTAAGVVCVVRSTTHTMVAVCGRFAIPGVVREDLRAALAAVEGGAVGAGDGAARLAESAPDAAADAAVRHAAERLISAAQRDLPA